jgi:hypothetical protein
MLEQQPENFWQKLSASFSRGLDKLGITQEEAYKRLKEDAKKQEPETKMAKGGSVKGFKPCASCPTPAKCKAAGKCLAKKAAKGMLVIPVKVSTKKMPAQAKKK